MTAIWQQENDSLAVSIAADGAMTVLLKADNVTFRTGRIMIQEDNPVDIGHVWLRAERIMVEEYPGTFTVSAKGDALRVTLVGREDRIVGQFVCRPRLDGGWFELAIIEIDESIPSLVFPLPFEAESLVIPQNVGKWIRQPIAYPVRRWWAYPVHLNMRWFGGLKGDYGWLAILDRGFANGGVLAAEMSAAPGWLKSHGHWRDMPRVVRYHFGRGGYVELAKHFRAYAIANGLFRSLKDKIAARPTLADLRGGRQLSLFLAHSTAPDRYEDLLRPVPEGVTGHQLRVGITFAQAANIVSRAQSLGMRRGLVNLRGWIKGGYDESHPDIWPPEAALGTIDELKALLALPDPLLTVLHDNYQDIYRQSASYPHGIIQSPTGDYLRGGIWAGGQSYIVNSRDSLIYAARNWATLQTLAPRGIFIDTTIATQLYESYEPGNELSRDQDLVNKRQLLRFYTDQNQVIGSEEGQDFGMADVDWIENRHRHVPGESIPLWPLVFHDAAFCYRYSAQAQSPDKNAPTWLADLLWGYGLLITLNAVADWTALEASFASTFDVDRWHERIGLDEMLNHRFLTDDGLVEESTFAHGTITVNFASEPRTVSGVTLPAYSFETTK